MFFPYIYSSPCLISGRLEVKKVEQASFLRFLFTACPTKFTVSPSRLIFNLGWSLFARHWNLKKNCCVKIASWYLKGHVGFDNFDGIRVSFLSQIYHFNFARPKKNTHYGLHHGVWTQREREFFFENPKLFGLGIQIGLKILGAFSANLSAPCFPLTNHYFYKELSLCIKIPKRSRNLVIMCQ